MSAVGGTPAFVKLTSRADELTVELLDAIIQTRYPAVSIDGFDLLESRQYGEQMVSTSGRAILKKPTNFERRRFVLNWSLA